MAVRPAIIPCLRYDDAPAAILFLCDAFGFLPNAVHTDGEDQRIVHHAQLVLDGNMIMLASTRDDPDDTYRWTSPEEAGGVTMTIYIVIDDLDAHHAAAVAAGAEIIDPPRDNDGYPGRGYTACDPEGQVWSFGDYDPFAPPPADG